MKLPEKDPFLKNLRDEWLHGRFGLDDKGRVVERLPLVFEVQLTCQFNNNCLAEMWSGTEESSYVRLIIAVSLNSRLESNKEE